MEAITAMFGDVRTITTKVSIALIIISFYARSHYSAITELFDAQRGHDSAVFTLNTMCGNLSSQCAEVCDEACGLYGCALTSGIKDGGALWDSWESCVDEEKPYGCQYDRASSVVNCLTCECNTGKYKTTEDMYGEMTPDIRVIYISASIVVVLKLLPLVLAIVNCRANPQNLKNAIVDVIFIIIAPLIFIAVGELMKIVVREFKGWIETSSGTQLPISDIQYNFSEMSVAYNLSHDNYDDDLWSQMVY